MRLAHTPYGLIRRWPSFFRARRAGIKRPVARATGGDRREFLSFEPGASRPRQRLCRPSGAGVLGKQRVVYETHIVAQESRPCGSELDVDFG